MMHVRCARIRVIISKCILCMHFILYSYICQQNSTQCSKSKDNLNLARKKRGKTDILSEIIIQTLSFCIHNYIAETKTHRGFST